jgi:UDP-glucose 4-epimerase
MFRYFNPAGCEESLAVGEHHNPETHVIPCIVETLLGKRKEFLVYGNDYPTPDGTCIRDYIRIEDLVEAHLLAMEKIMRASNICEAYNLGTNKGTSVMELVVAAEKVAGQKLNYKIAPRRPGDPSKSIADASKAMKELSWQPKRTDIGQMIKSCYDSFKSCKP